MCVGVCVCVCVCGGGGGGGGHKNISLSSAELAQNKLVTVLSEKTDVLSPCFQFFTAVTLKIRSRYQNQISYLLCPNYISMKIW